MIDLTVKTLDSQNHTFSLDDDITVRGFKEHIAESVAVPAESQRLIYCGRVLQDEKKLNEYDVNGKVIHLVQRAPPQSTQRGNSGGQSQGQGQGWTHPQRMQYHTHAQVHGNMYLGTMSFPTGVEGQVLAPQLSNTLSNSRLVVARRMLNRASQLIDRLDDPTSSSNPSPTESTAPPVSQQQEQIPQEAQQEQNDNNEARPSSGGNFAEAAVSAAIAAALSAAGLNNVALIRGNEENSESGITVNVVDGNQSDPQQQQQQQQQGTAPSSDEQTNARAPPQVPRPPLMAELLERLLSIQDRLRPYIESYRVLMLNDPSLPPGAGPERVEQNQRIVDGVSESLHYISHASHALSDIIVDMGQQPPRNLRCRPIIIQHSAVLQAGIPIQVEAHISLHGRNANNNNNDAPETNGTANQPTADPVNTAESTNVNSENVDQQRDTATTNNQQQAQQPPAQSQSAFDTMYNVSNNVEVLMEVSPEGNMETAPEGEQNQSNGTNNNNNNNNNNNASVISGSVSGMFPWGSTSSPDFIRNLMQVVAGHMAQGGGPTAVISTSNATSATGDQQTTTAATDSANPNPVQSTQARSNTGTHPTTSTQTRSTSRPYVFHPHPHPLGAGIGQPRDFDPFLPCNSHHVRRNASTTSTPTANQQQNQTTSQVPAPDSQSQTQSATSSSSQSNATNSNTTPPPTSQATGNDPFASFLRNLGQSRTNANPSANGATLSQSLGNLMQSFLGDNVHVEFIDDGAGQSEGSFTLADLLESNPNLGADGGSNQEPRRGENLLVDLILLLVRSMTLNRLSRLRSGHWEQLASDIRRPLREFFQDSFATASSPSILQEQATECLLSELRPQLQIFLEAEDDTDGRNAARIDVPATIEALLRRHIRNILKILFDDDADVVRFGQGLCTIVNDLGRQLCTMLRYWFQNDVQAGLEAIAMDYATFVGLRHSIRKIIITNFRRYSLRVPQAPNSEIIPLLVYRDVSNPPVAAPTVSNHQQKTQEPEPEPMEVETVENATNNETLMINVNEDEEENPGTFPGHEALPSDWVPIIARDGIRQRHQLQQGVASGGVTTLSDAYLGGMPSKRRKLIEQQKPRLLASPTPNHSSISISMERLVREGVTRAGVEEVDGAAVAVATDPEVRRAFGQAIRDCLHPRRYRTLDFPDPSRFPNATKYFADHKRPSK